jgi:heme/copper-type cytochrome/quinol oxidase subunit 1
MGMTRRMQHYDNLSWQPWLLVAAAGAAIILAGIVCQVIQLVVSIRHREQLRVTGDPWNGRTLEWSTASPPPAWNFAVLPRVAGTDAPALELETPARAKGRRIAAPPPHQPKSQLSITNPGSSPDAYAKTALEVMHCSRQASSRPVVFLL